MPVGTVDIEVVVVGDDDTGRGHVPRTVVVVRDRRFFGRRNKITSTFVESDFICYAVLLHSVSGERRIKVYSN